MVSPAFWLYDIKRFVQRRATSGIFGHGLGLRNCSPVARDQEPVARKKIQLEIDLAGSANGIDKVLLLPSPNLEGQSH